MPFSDIIRDDLREHLERFVSGDDEALVFTSPMGTPMRHSNLYLHSPDARQRMLADAVGEAARAALRKADGAKKASGTEVARRRRKKA